MNIRAGTLDDTRWLVPAVQINTKSAQPWIQAPRNVECYDTKLDDFGLLTGKWRAMWPKFFPPADVQ